VLKPIEGTILTVVRAAAEGASAASHDGANLARVLRAARTSARDALARTPEQLPVLKDAGVVDAGGAGFVLLLDAALHVVDGEPLPEPDEGDGPSPSSSRRWRTATPPTARSTSASCATRSCTSSTSSTTASRPSSRAGARSATRSWWSAATDCGTATCTPTTSAPRSRSRSTSTVGRQIRVTDLFEEVADEHAHREAALHGGHPPFTGHSISLPPVTCAVVAVASGDGLVELFGNLGVQGVVTGGQTLNPSTAELLAAVEAVNADQVVVLPNNKNIIPVAEQLDALTPKQVVVVPTTSMPEALAALVVYDPEASADDNGAEMADAASSVATGEITQAVRDTNSPAGAIAEGDWIGIVRGDGIVAVADGVVEASTRCSARWSPPAARSSRSSGGRRHRGRHRRDRRVARRPAAPGHRSRCTEAASRCTRTCSAWSDGPEATAPMNQVPPPLSLRDLDAIGPSSASGGSASASRPRCARWASRPCSTSSRTTRAAGSIARTRRGSATSRSARRRWCSSRCAASRSGSRRTARRWSPRWSVTAAAGSRSPSSTSRGARSSCTEGLNISLFGKPEVFRGGLQMTNPIVDLIGDRTGRIVPIYPQSEKVALTTWEIAGFVENALERCMARGIADPVPFEVQRRLGLLDRTDALRLIHLPETMADQARARRRLAFDELLRVQTVLVMRKRALERESKGIRHVVDGELVARLRAALPYELTGAQQRAIAEIEADLAGVPHPMHRLLQGDVGAGKTLVAVSAMLTAVQGGHQAALMAPTEVLAEQHAAGVRRLLDGVTVPDPGNLFGDRPLRVELLTNRVTGGDRKDVLSGLADGTVDIAIGTHALIQDGVRSTASAWWWSTSSTASASSSAPRCVTRAAGSGARRARDDGHADPAHGGDDGVRRPRRERARRAAAGPHADHHALGQRPARREPLCGPTCATRSLPGRQAYVVCPLIDESEKLELASAQETFEELSTASCTGCGSRCCTADAERPRRRCRHGPFRRGELDVLVPPR
jgi:hypothetical protein